MTVGSKHLDAYQYVRSQAVRTLDFKDQI